MNTHFSLQKRISIVLITFSLFFLSSCDNTAGVSPKNSPLSLSWPAEEVSLYVVDAKAQLSFSVVQGDLTYELPDSVLSQIPSVTTGSGITVSSLIEIPSLPPGDYVFTLVYDRDGEESFYSPLVATATVKVSGRGEELEEVFRLGTLKRSSLRLQWLSEDLESYEVSSEAALQLVARKDGELYDVSGVSLPDLSREGLSEESSILVEDLPHGNYVFILSYDKDGLGEVYKSRSTEASVEITGGGEARSASFLALEEELGEIRLGWNEEDLVGYGGGVQASLQLTGLKEGLSYDVSNAVLPNLSAGEQISSETEIVIENVSSGSYVFTLRYDEDGEALAEGPKVTRVGAEMGANGAILRVKFPPLEETGSIVLRFSAEDVSEYLVEAGARLTLMATMGGEAYDVSGAEVPIVSEQALTAESVIRFDEGTSGAYVFRLLYDRDGEGAYYSAREARAEVSLEGRGEEVEGVFGPLAEAMGAVKLSWDGAEYSKYTVRGEAELILSARKDGVAYDVSTVVLPDLTQGAGIDSDSVISIVNLSSGSYEFILSYDGDGAGEGYVSREASTSSFSIDEYGGVREGVFGSLADGVSDLILSWDGTEYSKYEVAPSATFILSATKDGVTYDVSNISIPDLTQGTGIDENTEIVMNALSEGEYEFSLIYDKDGESLSYAPKESVATVSVGIDGAQKKVVFGVLEDTGRITLRFPADEAYLVDPNASLTMSATRDGVNYDVSTLVLPDIASEAITTETVISMKEGAPGSYEFTLSYDRDGGGTSYSSREASVAVSLDGRGEEVEGVFGLLQNAVGVVNLSWDAAEYSKYEVTPSAALSLSGTKDGVAYDVSTVVLPDLTQGAGIDSNSVITITNLASGEYVFSLAYDKDGAGTNYVNREASTSTFPIDAYGGVREGVFGSLAPALSNIRLTWDASEYSKYEVAPTATLVLSGTKDGVAFDVSAVSIPDLTQGTGIDENSLIEIANLSAGSYGFTLTYDKDGEAQEYGSRSTTAVSESFAIDDYKGDVSDTFKTLAAAESTVLISWDAAEYGNYEVAPAAELSLSATKEGVTYDVSTVVLPDLTQGTGIDSNSLVEIANLPAGAYEFSLTYDKDGSGTSYQGKVASLSLVTDEQGGEKAHVFSPLISLYIYIPDVNMRRKVESELGKAIDEDITKAEAAAVTGLTLSSSSIVDLTGLEYFTSLTGLSLHNNPISDFSIVGDLTSLISLTLSNTWLDNADIAHLSGLVNLQSLNLSGTNNASLTDISVVSNFNALTYLNLSYTGVQDISVLNEMTSITNLNVSFTSINNSDLPAIGTLTGLITLDISGTDITTLSNFENLNALEDLTARFLPLLATGTDYIRITLPQLLKLTLSDSDISNPGLYYLSLLMNLTYLDIGGDTGINSLDYLANMTTTGSRFSLNVSNNRLVTDLNPLYTFSGLTRLYITGTIISQTEHDQFRAARPDVSVYYY